MKTRFTYDPDALTATQREQIAVVTEAHDARIKELRDEEDRRAEHYYDCVDEYSYGGICTRLNERLQRSEDEALQIRIEQIVRGGYIIRERRVNILRDIATGEVAACGTRVGEYGRYFRTYEAFGNKCISCAKRVATYEKKGFRPYVQTVTEKLKLAGYWRNGDLRFDALGVIDVAEELSTEIVY